MPVEGLTECPGKNVDSPVPIKITIYLIVTTKYRVIT